MDDILQDIRYAIRLCLRPPGFTAIAAIALALGIGANTAIFTIVNAVLLEPLPFRDPGRLVVLWETNVRRPGRPNVLAPANFIRWQERTTAFERMAPFYDYRVNLTGSGAPEEIVGMDVTPDFFPTLGIAPVLGRAFTADEGPEGHDAVVVLSQRVNGGSVDIYLVETGTSGNESTITATPQAWRDATVPGIRHPLGRSTLLPKETSQ